MSVNLETITDKINLLGMENISSGKNISGSYSVSLNYYYCDELFVAKVFTEPSVNKCLERCNEWVDLCLHYLMECEYNGLEFDVCGNCPAIRIKDGCILTYPQLNIDSVDEHIQDALKEMQ